MVRKSRKYRYLLGLALLILLIVPYAAFAQDTPEADITMQATLVESTVAPDIDETVPAPVEEPAETINTTELVTSMLQMIGIGFATLATVSVVSIAGFTLVIRGWRQNPDMVKASETVGDALPDPTQQLVTSLMERVVQLAEAVSEVAKFVQEATDGVPAAQKPPGTIPVAEALSGNGFSMTLPGGNVVEVNPGGPTVVRGPDQADTKPVAVTEVDS